jgi:hypothetical protein
MFSLLHLSRSPPPFPNPGCSLHVFTVNAAKNVDPKVLSTLASPDVLEDDEDEVSAKLEKVYQVDYDSSKAKKIFGIKYKTEKDCATDMIADFGKRGW